jgi:hypothetical protein
MYVAFDDGIWHDNILIAIDIHMGISTWTVVDVRYVCAYIRRLHDIPYMMKCYYSLVEYMYYFHEYMVDRELAICTN